MCRNSLKLLRAIASMAAVYNDLIASQDRRSLKGGMCYGISGAAELLAQLPVPGFLRLVNAIMTLSLDWQLIARYVRKP